MQPDDSRLRRKDSRYDAKIERLSNAITELIDFSSQGVPVLVEGKKDEDALKGLGVTGLIIRVREQSRKLYELAEELATYDSIIILTDFDREGEKLAKEITRYLQLWGVQTIMRDRIRNAVSWATRQIEGLRRIEALKEKLNNNQLIIES